MASLHLEHRIPQVGGGAPEAGSVQAGHGQQSPEARGIFAVLVPFSGGGYAAVCQRHGELSQGWSWPGALAQVCPQCVEGNR